MTAPTLGSALETLTGLFCYQQGSSFLRCVKRKDGLLRLEYQIIAPEIVAPGGSQAGDVLAVSPARDNAFSRRTARKRSPCHGLVSLIGARGIESVNSIVTCLPATNVPRMRSRFT